MSGETQSASNRQYVYDTLYHSCEKGKHISLSRFRVSTVYVSLLQEYQRHERSTVAMEPYCEIVDEFLTCTQEPIRHACGPEASVVVKRILLQLADRMFSGRCGLLRGLLNFLD